MDGLRPPAGRHHDRIANPGVAGSPQLQGRTIEPIESLHQTEPALLIDGERVTRDHAPVVAGDPDGLSLGDEIADRQHKSAFADHHSAAGPLLAQNLGGVGVFGDRRLDGHDRSERAIEIETGAARYIANSRA